MLLKLRQKSKDNIGYIFIRPFFFIAIPLFLLIIGYVLYVFIVTNNNINNRVTLLQEGAYIASMTNTAILASSFIATVYGLTLAYKNYEAQARRDQLRNSVEQLNKIVLGRFTDIRTQLGKLGINPYQGFNYLIDKQRLEEKNLVPLDDYQRLVRDMLNSFDLICTCIR
jgi:hypothetical protein